MEEYRDRNRGRVVDLQTEEKEEKKSKMKEEA